MSQRYTLSLSAHDMACLLAALDEVRVFYNENGMNKDAERANQLQKRLECALIQSPQGKREAR